MPISPMPPFTVFATKEFHIDGSPTTVTLSAQAWSQATDAMENHIGQLRTVTVPSFTGTAGDNLRLTLSETHIANLSATKDSAGRIAKTLSTFAGDLRSAKAKMAVVRTAAGATHTSLNATALSYNAVEASYNVAAATGNAAALPAIAAQLTELKIQYEALAQTWRDHLKEADTIKRGIADDGSAAANAIADEAPALKNGPVLAGPSPHDLLNVDTIELINAAEFMAEVAIEVGKTLDISSNGFYPGSPHGATLSLELGEATALFQRLGSTQSRSLSSLAGAMDRAAMDFRQQDRDNSTWVEKFVGHLKPTPAGIAEGMGTTVQDSALTAAERSAASSGMATTAAIAQGISRYGLPAASVGFNTYYDSSTIPEVTATEAVAANGAGAIAGIGAGVFLAAISFPALPAIITTAAVAYGVTAAAKATIY